MRTRTVLISLAAVAVVLGAAGFADAQCAMCKAVLMGSPEGRHLSESLNQASAKVESVVTDFRSTESAPARSQWFNRSIPVR